MLLFQYKIEVVLEALSFIIGLAGYSDGLSFAWCRALFDEVLDVVVVDVVCAHTSVDQRRLDRDWTRQPLHHLAAMIELKRIIASRGETHMHSKPGSTAGGAFVRTSSQSMVWPKLGDGNRGKLADEASVMQLVCI